MYTPIMKTTIEKNASGTNILGKTLSCIVTHERGNVQVAFDTGAVLFLIPADARALGQALLDAGEESYKKD